MIVSPSIYFNLDEISQFTKEFRIDRNSVRFHHWIVRIFSRLFCSFSTLSQMES